MAGSRRSPSRVRPVRGAGAPALPDPPTAERRGTARRDGIRRILPTRKCALRSKTITGGSSAGESRSLGSRSPPAPRDEVPDGHKGKPMHHWPDLDRAIGASTFAGLRPTGRRKGSCRYHSAAAVEADALNGRKILAGTPPARTHAGSEFVTTAPAATTVWAPMDIPGITDTPAPNHTSSPIEMLAHPSPCPMIGRSVSSNSLFASTITQYGAMATLSPSTTDDAQPMNVPEPMKQSFPISSPPLALMLVR